MVTGERAVPPCSGRAPVTDPASGGGRSRSEWFLAPLPGAGELPEASEEPSPELAGSTTVEPARTRLRGVALLAGAVALFAAVVVLGDGDEGGNQPGEAIATTTTARPATTTTTPLVERPATGALLPEPTGAALVVVTSSEVLVVELDTGAVRSVAVADRHNYQQAWAVGDAVFVQAPGGAFAVPVAPDEGPVVLTGAEVADWLVPSDRPGHVWLASDEETKLVGREVGSRGQETGRRFVLPALLSPTMVPVNGGLVVQTLGSLTFYEPDTGAARAIGHGIALAGSGDTLARLSCEALRCGLSLTDLRTGDDVAVSPSDTASAPIAQAAFSPDGRWLAVVVRTLTGATDRMAVVDVADGEVVAVHATVMGPGNLFAFSPDSRWLLLVDGRDVVAHRLGTEETVTLERLHAGGAVALAVVPIGE